MEEKPNVKKNKGVKMSFRTRLILLLVLIIVILSGTFYFYYQNTADKKAVYENSKSTYDLVLEEHKRCSQLLAKESGNFTDYEYCRKFTQTFQINY